MEEAPPIRRVDGLCQESSDLIKIFKIEFSASKLDPDDVKLGNRKKEPPFPRKARKHVDIALSLEEEETFHIALALRHERGCISDRRLSVQITSQTSQFQHEHPSPRGLKQHRHS